MSGKPSEEPNAPARPSWEVAAETRQTTSPTRPAPAPPPSYTPPAPGSRPAAPPYYAAPPPASTTNQAASAEAGMEYDLAGNPIPQTASAPSPYAPPSQSGFSPGPMPPPAGAWPPAPTQQPGRAGGGASYAVASNRVGPDKMLLGIALALAIGIVGGILIEKILVYAHFGLSLLYVGMGYGIGWGLHRVTGRGGAGMAMLAVGLMVACLGVSHLVWAQDILNEARRQGAALPGMTLFDVLPVSMQPLGFMHWVCITFGLIACYRGVVQQNG